MTTDKKTNAEKLEYYIGSIRYDLVYLDIEVKNRDLDEAEWHFGQIEKAMDKMREVFKEADSLVSAGEEWDQ